MTNAYIRAFLLQMHLTLDVLVISAFFSWGLSSDCIAVVAIVEHQQELVGYFLLDFDGLVVSNKVEYCFL